MPLLEIPDPQSVNDQLASFQSQYVVSPQTSLEVMGNVIAVRADLASSSAKPVIYVTWCAHRMRMPEGLQRAERARGC
jgi:hypothetical protein